MYKRYDYEQLQTFGGSFFYNLKKILKQENARQIQDFLKNQFTFGDETYYREGSDALFRFKKNQNDDGVSYVFIDEKEKIELLVDTNVIKKINSFLKSKNSHIKGDNVMDVLFQEYQEEKYRTINNKPYIVYDVETLYATVSLKGLAFELGYTITSSESNEIFDKQFKYVDKESIKKYVDYLLDFDGYIIGFNNIGFDNIVIAYNADYGQDVIDKLNSKTIDIFYYLRNLTNKRMWLNKIATALIGLQKTLTWGGVEGVELLKDWLSTGNKDALKKVKDYCKWDVKMTLWVLLYLYKFGEFFIDDKQFNFNEEEFIALSRDIKKNDSKTKNIENKVWLF